MIHPRELGASHAQKWKLPFWLREWGDKEVPAVHGQDPPSTPNPVLRWTPVIEIGAAC